VTSGASFDLQRCVLENKRALFVAVTFYASCIGADSELCLLLLKSAMRVVAIAAVHRAFKNLVVKRLAELSFRLGVTGHAKLRLVLTEHSLRRLTRLLCGDVTDERYRAVLKLFRSGSVRAVTIGTADVVAPMLAPTKVIMVLFTGMAAQTRFRSCLGVEPLEPDYFRDVAG